MKKKTRATAARTAKRRKSGRAVAQGRAAAHNGGEGSGASVSPAGGLPDPTPNRPFGGCGPNWRGRKRESTNCRPPRIPTSCWRFPTGAVSSASSIARSPTSSAISASGALIVLDVDRLKPINDAFGHAAGDQVLKAIVAVLLRQVRASDVIGRLGGDEFALLLWNLSETDAHAKAASLEQAIDRLSFVFGGRMVTAGASAGVAILGPHAEAGRALEEADSAMYVRKAQRRHET